MIEPYKIYWDYFTNYYKHCDTIAMKGACYAMVFNDIKPTHFQQPYEFKQCVQILVEAGKSQSRSRTYCLCSVKKMSEKYTDTELDKIVNKGMEYLNKKTKSIAKKCAKEANAN